ncbi:hypothetical protein AMK27_05175 [Streptomyces sp. CB02009]|uniref:hypothetical protein n=1 Tax=Streptomyces sp. CB02009 TaxID=1703938 RepID=UPI00093E2F86|nr:hypothetical protein [Streptomyces sp. CB02009]OKJ65204.1 hypothetical protein AMK27_05175 [Streptomyces sp. CB02009]
MVDSTDTRCPGSEDASVTAFASAASPASSARPPSFPSSASTATPRTFTLSGRTIRRRAVNALPKLFPDEPAPSRQDFAGRRSTFRSVRTDTDPGQA